MGSWMLAGRTDEAADEQDSLYGSAIDKIDQGALIVAMDTQAAFAPAARTDFLLRV